MLGAFEMRDFIVSSSNQDVALNQFENLKQNNIYNSENQWRKGVSGQLHVSLRTLCGESSACAALTCFVGEYALDQEFVPEGEIMSNVTKLGASFTQISFT